ncbi:MAG: diguanylate cyclase [Syntrophaceae bacterium]|nr:diguanylate cyclase [Syntrophaceae bacterium]
MNVIYLRTFFVSYVLFIALCVIVIASLWWYNRKRSPEIALWLTDYVFQLTGLIFITLRELIPDFLSVVVANVFIIGGTIILYIGLGRYVEKKISQFHNYIMLTIFTLAQIYFTYIYPSAAWRMINLSIALFYICAQASWLMLRGANISLRSATRTSGIVFAFFCLVSVVQIIVNLIVPETHTLIVSNLFGIFAVVMYQILFVALTFALFLMVSRRLSMDLEKEMFRREQEERIVRLRLSLSEFATNHSLEEVLQKTLDEVGDMVESPIGFYHFVEEDQKTLSLQAWSTRTLNEFCKAEGKGMHYAIDQAGVWTDCVHQRRAIIHNDYLSLPHRKGMPEGHAAVIRELVVPIMRGGKVMAILGVGNKPSDYNEKDVEIVSYLADVAWEITRRKKAEEAVSRYSNDLKERLKEINCLYSISEIVQKKDVTQEELFKACPAIISRAYRFPEIAACRILIGDHTYSTDNFRQTQWSQNKIIKVNGEPVGLVEVCYLEERRQESEGPFLAEERSLFDTVAGILERYLEGKEAQDALRTSEEKYKQLVEVFPETIFETNMKGDVTYANPYGLNQFGFTQDDIAKGINIFDYVTPDDRELVIERIQRRINGDVNGYLEYNALKKDGSTFHALALSVPIIVEGMVVGIRGFILDITERKRAEEAIKSSEAQVRLLLNSTAEGIYGIDIQSKCTFANPSCLNMLGYETMEQILGRNMHELAHHSYPDGNPMTIDQCAIMVAFHEGTGMHRDDEVFWRADGTNFPVEYWSYPQIVNSEIFGAVVTFIDITERKRTEETIKHLATHDLLTDLPSMRLAGDRLSRAIQMARRHKKAGAVMFIDLDGFKSVNDTLGHDAGDYVLKQVAQRLLSCVRETDTVARVGGDEFLIIATEIISAENVVQIAEKIIQTVSQPIIFHNQGAVVNTSIGIALFPEHSEDMDTLIKLADEAMYKVKNAGKNNFRFVNN